MQIYNVIAIVIYHKKLTSRTENECHYLQFIYRWWCLAWRFVVEWKLKIYVKFWKRGRHYSASLPTRHYFSRRSRKVEAEIFHNLQYLWVHFRIKPFVVFTELSMTLWAFEFCFVMSMFDYFTGETAKRHKFGRSCEVVLMYSMTSQSASDLTSSPFPNIRGKCIQFFPLRIWFLPESQCRKSLAVFTKLPTAFFEKPLL